MQGKTKLYVDKNTPNVEKIHPNVDEKRVKKWAMSQPARPKTMKNTAPPRALRGQGFYGGSAPDSHRHIKTNTHHQGAVGGRGALAPRNCPRTP